MSVDTAFRRLWRSPDLRYALSQPTTLLGLAMIVGCWISLGFELAMEYSKTFENAKQRANSLAKQFEDHTNTVASASLGRAV